MVTYGTHGARAHGCGGALGIDAEVIDIRSIVPLDVETIVNSVKKTGRCVVAHEATRFARLRRGDPAATVQEECFWHLEAPIERVAGLGHALSARVRVGILSGPGARRRRAEGKMEAS